MRHKIFSLFRSWQELNHQGLTEGDFKGLGKFKRAKAIWFLTASAPMIPLIVSDWLDIERGWLWHSWGVLALTWAGVISGMMIWHTGKSLASYIRTWRDKRR